MFTELPVGQSCPFLCPCGVCVHPLELPVSRGSWECVLYLVGTWDFTPLCAGRCPVSTWLGPPVRGTEPTLRGPRGKRKAHFSHLGSTSCFLGTHPSPPARQLPSSVPPAPGPPALPVDLQPPGPLASWPSCSLFPRSPCPVAPWLPCPWFPSPLPPSPPVLGPPAPWLPSPLVSPPLPPCLLAPRPAVPQTPCSPSPPSPLTPGPLDPWSPGSLPPAPRPSPSPVNLQPAAQETVLRAALLWQQPQSVPFIT